MTKISERAAEAFFKHDYMQSSNTMVLSDALYLFNNKIAVNNGDGTITIRDCGWKTRTTMDRLNGLGVNLSLRKKEWILNGEKWDGKDKTIAL